MILEVLIVVTMFLWFLTLVPHPALSPFTAGGYYLAFVAVLLLCLYLFMPALRG